MSNFELFKQVQLFFQKTESLEDDDKCFHNETTVEGGTKICMECGQLLEENCLVVQSSAGMRQRKRDECSIYKEIPTFISQKTKEKTIEMYKNITDKNMYRTLRKSIILGCLHRACILCNEPVCYDDLLEMMELKANKASKGINYVSTNIPKDSEYSIPFFNDKMLIDSIMTNLGLESHTYYIKNMVSLVKQNSDIFNNSHYKSVVCGCIFLWIQMNNINITIKQFSVKMKISIGTMVTKYKNVKTVVLKTIMKELFSELLSNCKTRYGTKITSKVKGVLIEPREKYEVYNFSDISNITVKDCDGEELPLNDVTDIEDWNLLTDVKYYDHEGSEYGLNVCITETKKDITINFDKYNERNSVSGERILESVIIKTLS